MNKRRLTPEILDSLPAYTPEALASRRDLHVLNAIMGHRRHWAHWFRSTFPSSPPRQLAELGCGDAALVTETLTKLWPRGGGTLYLLDRSPVIAPHTLRALGNAGWDAQVIAADVFEWLDTAPQMDAVTTNLFLHHFESAPLASLFVKAGNITSRFAALEPARAWFARAAVSALPLIDAHPVTRHDARASVEAGFRAGELSTLWPQPGWQLEDRRMFPFSHWFSATRV